MTHFRSAPWPTRRRAGATVVGVATATVAVMAMATPASAARPSTKSPEIAAEANQALDAFHRWQDTERPLDYIEYVRHRSVTAELTAGELGAAPGEFSEAWSAVDDANQVAILAAMSQLGVPYQSIASEPGVGFDCSGLTSYAYGQAFIGIPRSSGTQINASERIDRADAEPGDLVHYPGHVGIYLGSDVYIHAPYTGSHVEAVQMPDRSLSFGDVTN